MSFWRHHRRHRRLCGWLAMLAMAAHLVMGAVSGLAQAAASNDSAFDDWPFGDLVICTADGVQTGQAAGGEQPVRHSGAGNCDACASVCCGGAVCGRIGASVVLREVPPRHNVNWRYVDFLTSEPAILSAFSSRAPPYSA